MPKSSAARVHEFPHRKQQKAEVTATPADGTFRQYPALVTTLPPLVRKQRRLEAKIAPLTPLVEDEKACRAEIDALLVTAGIQKGEGVTCAGYDVTHIERKGTSRLNQDTLILALVAAGLAKDTVIDILAASTETGDPSTWATVKPCKGSKVRT